MVKSLLLDAIGMYIPFYVFNIEYPIDMKSTLGFVTQYVFGIEDSSINDRKITKLWDKLVS